MGAVYGSSYYTSKEGVTWGQGENHAKSLGGHLASINSGDEDIFLKNEFGRGWIGFTDATDEGNWIWTDGSAITYTNWDIGQPDNSRGIQHYGQVWTGSGKWDDAEEDTEQQAIAFNKIAIIEIPLSYFSISDATFREGKGGDVIITRTGGTTTSQKLKIISSDGSATLSDDDYTQVNQTVTFAAREKSQTINISTTADLNMESDESFTLTMTAEGSDEVPPQISDGSATITITNDDIKSAAPTYSLSLSTSSIDEKSQSSVRFNISTTDIDANTRLYYTLSGSGIDANDFSSGGIKSSGLIGSDGKATFVLSAAADITTEGTESFNLRLYSDSQRTNLVATSSSVSIVDTSTSPVKTPTYTLSLSPSSIDEGDAFRASIATTSVKAGTRLYYSIKGEVNSSDFSSPLTGSISINDNGNASFTNKATKDLFTEGNESAQVLFFSDRQRTLQIAKDSVIIRDTSKTPKKASFNISTNSSSLKEGDLLSTSVTTENLDPGSTLYWTLSGNGITKSDFSSGSLSGNSNLNKSGTFSLTHSIAKDRATEGKEQLTFKLFSDQNRNILLTQKTLDIADTSKTPEKSSLLSASVRANTLKLLFDSALDDTKPNHDRFSITADGKTINIRSSSLHATAGSLKLNLDSKITPNQAVKLAYNDLSGNQSSGVLQTPNGTDLSSFSTTATNTSSDDTPPSISSATIQGKSLSLSFSEALTQDFPRNQSWTLKEDGKAISVNSSSIDAAGAQLNLTLAAPVDRATNVTLSYKDLSGNQKSKVIQDLAGNDLASFSNFNVENQTTRSSDPLNIDTAEIDGDEIVLAFDRELDSTSPSKGTFRITANGKAIKATRIFLYPNDREAVLNIAKPVEHGDDVTLSYKDAKGNQKKNIIQDIDGNDLASINSILLTNNTRKSAKKFQLDYADADGKMINLYLSDRLSSSIPKASRFRITANDKKQIINSITTQPEEGLITLKLKKSINSKQDILISYRDLNGDQFSGTAEDIDGNDLFSFKNISPLNDSIDSDPPRLEDAFLDNQKLILEFDELLESGKVNNSRFKLRAGKKRIRIASAHVPQDDAIAILTLRSPLSSKASSLLLTYRDLKSDQSSLIIQDTDGNDLPSLRNFQVELISGDNNFPDLA